jgi:hypothetical protein
VPLRAHHIEMNRSRFSNARPIARENGRAQHGYGSVLPTFCQAGAHTRPYCWASRARNNLCIENTQFLYLFCARPEPYDCLERCWSCGCCSSCSCLSNYPYLRLWWATPAAFRRLPFCFAALLSALPSFRLYQAYFSSFYIVTGNEL